MEKNKEELFTAVLDRMDISKDLIKGLTEGESTIDDFSKEFGPKWLAKSIAKDDPDLVKEIMGSRMGAVTTKFNQTFGLSKSDTADKDMETIFAELKENQDKKLGDLQKQIEDSDQEGTIKSLNEKLEVSEGKAKEKEEEVLKVNQLMEQLKLDHSKERDAIEVKTLVGQELNGISWKSDRTDIEKIGFKAHLDSFKFKKEEDVLYPTKDGEKIRNEKDTGYITAKDFILKQATEMGQVKVNNTEPLKPKTVKVETDDKPLRTINPRAVENANKA